MLSFDRVSPMTSSDRGYWVSLSMMSSCTTINFTPRCFTPWTLHFSECVGDFLILQGYHKEVNTLMKFILSVWVIFWYHKEGKTPIDPYIMSMNAFKSATSGETGLSPWMWRTFQQAPVLTLTARFCEKMTLPGLSYTWNLRGIAFKGNILWYFDFSTK